MPWLRTDYDLIFLRQDNQQRQLQQQHVSGLAGHFGGCSISQWLLPLNLPLFI